MELLARLFAGALWLIILMRCVGKATQGGLQQDAGMSDSSGLD